MGPTRGSNDAELMAKAQAGDREAFAALYGSYWPRAVRMATVVCGTSRAARDVVRVGFGLAWKERASYNASNETVHSWLFGLVRDIASYARAGDDLWGRTRFAADQEESDSEAAEPDENDDVGAVAANAIAMLLVDAPDDQREAIAMAFFGELSPAEIAMHLDLPEETVEGRIRFGLEDLRRRKFAVKA